MDSVMREKILLIQGELGAAIGKECDRFGLDRPSVIAVILQESGGEAWATRFEPSFFKRYVEPLTSEQLRQRNPFLAGGVPSYDTERMLEATSFGLMQIMGSTARERGCRVQYLTELCRPAVGLHWGCSYLSHLAKKFGGGAVTTDVLYAWNRGPGSIKGTSPEEREQFKYVREVKEKLAAVREVLG